MGGGESRTRTEETAPPCINLILTSPSFNTTFKPFNTYIDTNNNHGPQTSICHNSHAQQPPQHLPHPSNHFESCMLG